MKERKGLWLLVMVLAIASLVGCAIKTPIQEMYLVPKLEDIDAIFNTKFVANPDLVVADTAFLQDLGITTPSYSWRVVVFRKNGDGDQKYYKLVTFRAEEIGKIFFPVIIPAKLKLADEDLIAVVDHSGTRLYNQRGQFVKVRGWNKIDPFNQKYKDFFTTVKQAGLNLVQKDTPIFNELIEQRKRVLSYDVAAFVEYLHQKYDVPASSPFNKETIELIKTNGDADWLMEVLLSNWYFALTYPLLTPAQYGVMIFVAKVFAITGKWWKEDLDAEGFMDRKLTAISAVRMFNFRDQLYGRKEIPINTMEMMISDKNRELIKGTPCAHTVNYGEYNACALKYNTEAQEFNRQVDEFNRKAREKR